MGLDDPGNFSGRGQSGTYSKKNKLVWSVKTFNPIFNDSHYSEDIKEINYEKRSYISNTFFASFFLR